MKDVAREAGVSAATASRALSGRRRVSPEVERAVLAASERLGYRVDTIARSLRMRTTGTVGMVVPGISNPYFPLLVEAVERRLSSDDRQLLLCDSRGDVRIEEARVRALLGRRVDGLLFVAADGDDSAATLRHAAAEVPVVQLDRYVDGPDIDYVGVENDIAIRTVVEYLRGRGCRTFAYLSSRPADSATRHRLAAYRSAVADAGGQGADRVLLGDYSLAWGRRAVARLRDAGPLPDAVICGADIIALGTIAELTAGGARVPQDVAVTGFDDISFAEVAQPPLTTLRQPAQLLADEAVRILDDRLAGDDGAVRRTSLPPDLVVRGSTP